MPGHWGNVKIDSIELSSAAYATYRLNVISNSDAQLSMFIDEQMTAYKLWCNNKPVISVGKVASNKKDAKPNRTPTVVDVNITKGNNELVFHISNFNHREGGFSSSPVIGVNTKIYRHQQLKRALDMFLLGSLFIMGIYFIMLFFVKTSIPGTLYIGLFSIILSLRTSLANSLLIADILPNLSWDTHYRLEYFSNYAAPVALLYFLHSLYKKEINRKVLKVYLVYSIIISFSLFLSTMLLTKLLFIYEIMLLLIIGYLCWRITVAAINKRHGAKTIIVTFLIFSITVVHDIFYYSGHLNWSVGGLVSVGTFVMVLGQIMALTRVFSSLMEDHEVLTYKLDYRNRNLDSMVRKRTKKLRAQRQSLLEKNEELHIQNEKIKSISHNLEEQKQRILYSEKKARNLLQLLPEAIFQIDSDGNLMYANDEFYNYIKYDKDSELNIKQIVNLENTEAEQFLPEIKQKIQDSRILKNLSLQIIRSDKTQFPALFSVAEVSEEDEVAYRCMFMDITSQVADEEKIVNAYRELRWKNKDITDSLLYAHTMQKAVMPHEELFAKVFSDYFIINKPQSIVSGDFYFISERDNKIVFALSDCTGHGVPGGFMTMLGITLLNELYSGSNKMPSPDIALGNMRSRIIDSLGQGNEPNSNKDGMDIILCVLDTETLVLEFASANQPLLILRDHEITTIKGDSMPVGIYLKMKDFSLKQVQLNKGDILYTFTDGIVDSFGGEKGRKLYLRGLRSMIEECYTKPMSEQGKYIETKFNKWQGKNKQIDDILVLGIKI